MVSTPREKANVICHYGLDKKDLAKRIEAGETFNTEKLLDMGFDKWNARNISGFLATGNIKQLFYE